MSPSNISGRAARDVILFVFALFGLLYQMIIASVPNPTLITGFFGLLGLPLFIRGDELRRREKLSEREEPPDEPN